MHMVLRGTSLFVIVAGLCGSACNLYHGDRLTSEQQRELPESAAFDPNKFRDVELERVRSPDITILLRRDHASAPNAEPPEQPQASDPAVAGTQAPRHMQAPDPDLAPLAELDNADDAGTSPEPSDPDAGAFDGDAETPQMIATGRSGEADAGSARQADAGSSRDVDAGRARPVAKTSAACRDERGYEQNGRCYFVLETPVSWNVGRDRCYEHDAHLASVTSEQESDLIASFELEHDVWIGFSRFGAAHFSWLTNESGSFANWQKGAPRPMQESGALIKAVSGLWTNRIVSELHAALCETERRTSGRRSKN